MFEFLFIRSYQLVSIYIDNKNTIRKNHIMGDTAFSPISKMLKSSCHVNHNDMIYSFRLKKNSW